jgi:hypothetical protein
VPFILDYQPEGLGRSMDAIINQTMRGEVATLTNLKAYLESHPSEDERSERDVSRCTQPV